AGLAHGAPPRVSRRLPASVPPDARAVSTLLAAERPVSSAARALEAKPRAIARRVRGRWRSCRVTCRIQARAPYRTIPFREGAMANAPLPPRGINHMVLNVRNLEVSHKFWTEIIGFRCVAELKPIPGRTRPKMRFYSGLDAQGDVTHHDLALAEVPESNGGAAEPWNLMPNRVGLNHV